MKGLERLDLLPDPHKLHWLPNYSFDRQRCTTPRITIQLGQDRTINGHGFIECLSHLHGLLPGHSIHHEEGVMRVGGLLDVPQLLHEFLVDLQTTSRIEDDSIRVGRTHIVEGLTTDFHRIAGAFLRQDRSPYTLSKDTQLLHRSRTIDIRGNAERAVPHLL